MLHVFSVYIAVTVATGLALLLVWRHDRKQSFTALLGLSHLIWTAYPLSYLAARQPDGKATVWLDGSHELEVSGALTVGQTVYIKADRTLTATATGNNPWGVAVLAKGTGTGPAEVAPFGHNPAVATAAA